MGTNRPLGLKETKGKQMQDFDNWPLNTMPLNTGSTVLAVSQEESLNPYQMITKKF